MCRVSTSCFEFLFRLPISTSCFDFLFRFPVSTSCFDFQFRLPVSTSCACVRVRACVCCALVAQLSDMCARVLCFDFLLRLPVSTSCFDALFRLHVLTSCFNFLLRFPVSTSCFDFVCVCARARVCVCARLSACMRVYVLLSSFFDLGGSCIKSGTHANPKTRHHGWSCRHQSVRRASEHLRGSWRKTMVVQRLLARYNRDVYAAQSQIEAVVSLGGILGGCPSTNFIPFSANFMSFRECHGFPRF